MRTTTRSLTFRVRSQLEETGWNAQYRHEQPSVPATWRQPAGLAKLARRAILALHALSPYCDHHDPAELSGGPPLNSAVCCPLTFSFILLHRPSGAGNIHPPRSAASDSIFDCCGPTLDVPEPESTSVWPSHPGPLTYTQAPTTQTSARTKKVQHEILVLGLSSGRASSGLSDRSAPGPAASPLRRATGSGFEGD
eukprot:3348581-Rhodomonas_salina.1